MPKQQPAKILAFPRKPLTPVERIVEFYDTLDVASVFLGAQAQRAKYGHTEMTMGDTVSCPKCGVLKIGQGDPILHPICYLVETKK